MRSQDGSSSKIRVGCIDAPEYDQEYGPEASQRLKALLPSGADIELRKITTDQYGVNSGNSDWQIEDLFRKV